MKEMSNNPGLPFFFHYLTTLMCKLSNGTFPLRRHTHNNGHFYQEHCLIKWAEFIRASLCLGTFF